MSIPPLKPNSLIIIDDSSFDLKINAGIAKHIKVFNKIICFESGQKALDFLIDNSSNTDIFPILILLDIQMPEMDGFEFMDSFEKFDKPFKKQIHVTMLSSTDDLTDIVRAETNTNIIKLLKKPLSISELKALLSDIYIL